jgi:hypothetical protein
MMKVLKDYENIVLNYLKLYINPKNKSSYKKKSYNLKV